ncbi:hypothetical protein MNV49_007844 [Pseudohyphozyma bogoriensis]|nr:hypothetical protein MNV49_007844 [Pseudohyphozyma bogoriensis]
MPIGNRYGPPGRGDYGPPPPQQYGNGPPPNYGPGPSPGMGYGPPPGQGGYGPPPPQGRGYDYDYGPPMGGPGPGPGWNGPGPNGAGPGWNGPPPPQQGWGGPPPPPAGRYDGPPRWDGPGGGRGYGGGGYGGDRGEPSVRWEDRPRGGERRGMGRREEEEAKSRKIEERIAKERPCRTLFVRNLKYETTQEEVRAVFERSGEIRDFVDISDSKGMAFITYYDVRAAIHAKSALQGMMIGGRAIDVHYSLPRESDLARRCDRDKGQGTLLLSLSSSATSPILPPEIGQMFSRFGEVKEIFPHATRRGEDYIEFFDSRGAVRAYDEMDGAPFKGGKIQLEFVWDILPPVAAPPPPAPMPRSSGPPGAGPAPGGYGYNGYDRPPPPPMQQQQGYMGGPPPPPPGRFDGPGGSNGPGGYQSTPPAFGGRSPPRRPPQQGPPPMPSEEERLAQALKVQQLLASLAPPPPAMTPPYPTSTPPTAAPQVSAPPVPAPTTDPRARPPPPATQDPRQRVPSSSTLPPAAPPAPAAATPEPSAAPAIPALPPALLALLAKQNSGGEYEPQGGGQGDVVPPAPSSSSQPPAAAPSEVQALLNVLAQQNRWGNRVSWALEELGAKYDVVHIDFANKPSYYFTKVNPAGLVPVLQIGPSLDDSTKIPESAVIAEYIAEVFPKAKLLTSDPLKNAHGRYFAGLLSAGDAGKTMLQDTRWASIRAYNEEIAERWAFQRTFDKPYIVEYWIKKLGLTGIVPLVK